MTDQVSLVCCRERRDTAHEDIGHDTHPQT